MSDQITTAFVQQYKGTLYNLVQQKGSRLREAVTVEAVNGEFGYFDQIGATVAIERTSRHSDSPLVNTPHSRRQVTMRDFEWGDLIDNPDKVRLLVDPSSTYLQSAMWALGRKIDDIVIDAALGNAKTGKAGANPPVALPAGQKVPVSGTGLNLTKLLQAKETLDKNDVDPDDPRFIALTAKQVTDLLNSTEIKSSDYNTVKALAQGQLDTFLGFKFIRVQRLTVASNVRSCIAWTKSGLLLALGADIKGRVIERPDKSFSVYAYASLSCGATRMEEEKVVQLDCLES